MGLEPMISRTTIWRANQLHHTHHITYRTVFCPTKYHHIKFSGLNEPGGIRTLDLRLRRPLLYPAELQAHTCVSCPLTFKYSINFSSACQHFGGVFFAKSQNIFKNCLKFTRSAIVIRRRNDYNIFTPRLIDGFRAIKARTIKVKGIERDECYC